VGETDGRGETTTEGFAAGVETSTGGFSLRSRSRLLLGVVTSVVGLRLLVGAVDSEISTWGFSLLIGLGVWETSAWGRVRLLEALVEGAGVSAAVCVGSCCRLCRSLWTMEDEERRCKRSDQRILGLDVSDSELLEVLCDAGFSC